jgi:hypothetical protein
MWSAMGELEFTGGLPRGPGFRICCLLSPNDVVPDIIFGSGAGGLGVVDPSELGDHRFGVSNDVNGIIYSCSGGFLDVAHVRDTADLTYYYWQWLSRIDGKAGTSFPSFRQGGACSLTMDAPFEMWRQIARVFAYWEGLFHEIESWWELTPGGQQSSFSPEDLVSNFLGGYIGERALEFTLAGDEDLQNRFFEGNVTAQITQVLDLFGARTSSITEQALELVKGTWYSSDLAFALPTYIQRRNFDWDPVVPWTLSAITGCVSTTWPADIERELPITAKIYANAEYDAPSHCGDELPSRCSAFEFAAYVDVVKGLAKEKYGDLYDKPDL